MIWAEYSQHWSFIQHWESDYRIRLNTTPSWIEPHPLRNHAKMQFLCVFYVTIWGQKPILKNRTPGLHSSRYGTCHVKKLTPGKFQNKPFGRRNFYPQIWQNGTLNDFSAVKFVFIYETFFTKSLLSLQGWYILLVVPVTASLDIILAQIRGCNFCFDEASAQWSP